MHVITKGGGYKLFISSSDLSEHRSVIATDTVPTCIVHGTWEHCTESGRLVHSDNAVSLYRQREHRPQSVVAKHNVSRILCRKSVSEAVAEVNTVMAFRANSAWYTGTVNLSNSDDSLMLTLDIPLAPGPGTRHLVASGSKYQLPHVLWTTTLDNKRIRVLYFIACVALVLHLHCINIFKWHLYKSYEHFNIK